MKRLTISMSDELFSKLDSVENKSLFIRKLIERELDMLGSINDIDNNIPWERDIASLKGNVDELFCKLSEIEKQLNARAMQEIPDPVSQSCPASVNPEELQGSAHSFAPEIYGSSVTSHEATGCDLSDNDNTGRLPEITDENISDIHERTQDERYSLLVPGNTPTGSKSGHSGEEKAFSCEAENRQGDPLQKVQPKDETIQEHTIPEPAMHILHEQAKETLETKLPLEDRQDETIVMPELKSPVGTLPEQTIDTQAPEITVRIQQEQTIVIPELKEQMGDQMEKTIVIPELNKPMGDQMEKTIVSPELNKPMGTQQEQAMVMPELKPPVEMKMRKPGPFPDPAFGIVGDGQFAMPEPGVPEEVEQLAPFMQGMKEPPENNDLTFVMPRLEPPIATEETTIFKLPELKPEMVPTVETAEQQSAPAMGKQPLFKLHSMEPVQQEEIHTSFIAPAFDTRAENMQFMPFRDPQPGIDPHVQGSPVCQPAGNRPAATTAGNTSPRPGKLGSNILMYLPHGAKVKKDIIKSLISKQFSEDEIETRISELVASGVLKLAGEEGIQYLMRP
ncbi:MAG: hypothetical protein JW705_04035 [Methanosarcinaceae archaeon]|nr:hypothetical protein [Methanosarcinaceae archaeon]